MKTQSIRKTVFHYSVHFYSVAGGPALVKPYVVNVGLVVVGKGPIAKCKFVSLLKPSWTYYAS